MQTCPTDQLNSFLLGNVLISNVQASHELLVLASFTCNVLKQAFAQLFQELFGNNQFHNSVLCKLLTLDIQKWQGSGTLRHQLLIMHGIAWYFMA